jgi:hypothetical protein
MCLEENNTFLHIILNMPILQIMKIRNITIVVEENKLEIVQQNNIFDML